MSYTRGLNGLYVITDDTLTPDGSIYNQVEESLKGGASIVQLRDKNSSDNIMREKAIKIQALCRDYDALFVLNDKIDLAIEIGCDGLHIGKSDHDNFEDIRKNFKGVIGVSCYGDIELAKEFEKRGADYVAFGSFFASPTKPDSNIVSLDILSEAKSRLSIPICAIGGINSQNISQIMRHKPDMVSLISDIWTSEDIEIQSKFYTKKFGGESMTKIKLALEWFLNPDHLPMIAGLMSGKYKEAGVDLEMIAPNEHYDGFVQLKKGEIDLHCNEPLHLFEHHFDTLKSFGCFFETRGGVMIRADRVAKFRANEKIKITTPASNEITNKIGFEILSRYANKEGFELSRDSVEFVETDFWHINNMKNDESFDGAWLCFYNFEGIEAEFEKFDNLFIDQHLSPYPNFSALEFMSTDAIIQEKGEALCRFVEVTNDMAKYLKENIEEAKEMFYSYSGEEKSELMDEIIEDTIPRFETNIKADNKRWFELYKFLEELDIVKLDESDYNKIW